MAQHVEVNITIEGEEITPFSLISISQDIHHHHVFEVVLPVDAFENSSRGILEQSKGYIGKSIIIRFGPHLFERRHADNQFIGLITNIGVSRSGNGERQIVIRGNSPTIMMDGNGQCRSFTQKSLQDIANAMLEKVPRSLESHIGPQFGGTIPYVVQFNESNWAFLKRMAARYGEWCYYDGAKLVFGKLPQGTVVDLPFGEDLFNFEFDLRLLPTNGKAVAYNYLESKAYEGTTASAAVSDLDDFGKFALDQSSRIYSQEPVFASADVVVQQQELDDILLQQKASSARNMVVATGDSDNPHLNVGTVINITGEGVHEQDYGRFIITSVTHSISGTYSYSNGFTAIPAENQSPPAPAIRKPVGDIQPALIIDNADPEGLGRVKAQFYWQPAPESTPWIRVANTMAGNGKSNVHGFYFTPEVGDEVMVGFEDNNPDKPFVMGSVYHKKVAPSEWKDSSNQIKVIRTRNGNQIYLFDKDGKEEIKILNKDVGDPTNIISLSMDGEGKITIETKGELVMKAKSIQMDADEGIKITSGKATEMKAQELSVKTDQNIKMDAGQGIKTSSSQATEMKAMELKVDADMAINMKCQQMKLESSMAQLKAAANLDIDGGAMASVKAAIIKLN
ncbi:type VI secretion system Vgr family protein [Cesiribacter sp. SM1]|uniref:type VI secretion system Vgr family protein n=1 Tax=Cesiribacter sp. SM1 TaxID=2861196 RepID=UPI001CD2D1BC|nr:phage baseplate assembly protein V [Cesiribacter sp. SM1]